jgi:hypothetical protein
MGNAKSTNVAKAVVDIYSKIAAETVQTSTISTSNTQIISVDGSGGDVNISGNTITQTAKVNMTVLMDSISNVDSQKRIGVQLDQLAKSLVSGLNFFTFDDAKNTAESIVKSQTTINNAIRQSCALNANNVQSITIKNVKGSVNITNNVLSQMSEIFDKCALKSVLGVKAIDDVQQRLNQEAESKLEGFNLAWLAAAVLAFVLVPVLVAARVTSNALRFVFPLMIAIGGVFFALYFTLGKTYMKSSNYTRPFRDTCTGNVDGSVQRTTIVRQAMDACLKSSSCRVVDARLTETGGTVAKQLPEITFYKSGDGCKFQFYPQGVVQLAAVDVTAVKTTDRYQWLLYVGITMIIGGLLGTIIQRAKGGGGSGSSTSLTTSELTSFPSIE